MLVFDNLKKLMRNAECAPEWSVLKQPIWAISPLPAALCRFVPDNPDMDVRPLGRGRSRLPVQVHCSFRLNQACAGLCRIMSNKPAEGQGGGISQWNRIRAGISGRIMPDPTTTSHDY